MRRIPYFQRIKRRWPRFMLLFAGVLVPLIVVGIAAERLVNRARYDFETPLLLLVHTRATPALDRLALDLHLIGNWLFLAPASALILLYLWLRARRAFLFYLIAYGGALALNFTMKALFGEPRPVLWERIVPETSPSFPSGHAMGTAAFVTAAILLLWPTPFRWTVLLIGTLFSFMVGLSRLYLGVHYPTDVLVGWLTGAAWVIGVYLLLYRHLPDERSHQETGV